MWNPSEWPATVATVRSLREQLRRARAKNVAASRWDAADLEPGRERRRRLESLAERWQRSRMMPTMHFAVTLDLFGHPAERRFFAAEKGGELVGALIAVPIYARRGWLIEDLLRHPAAPNGTIELLVDAAMRDLAADGAEVVSMGMAPLSGVESPLLRAVRATTPWLFDWDGLRGFKAKLRPAEWRPVYAAFPRRERGITAIVDVLRCFAAGSLLRFGARTLVHRARAVSWLLAVLLIPWIAILVTPAAARFFPDDAIRAGWIAYDVALFAGMIALVAHWRRPLVRLLIAATALDAIGGAIQAVTWNAARASPVEWLVLVPALVAPVFACAFLFAADRADHG